MAIYQGARPRLASAGPRLAPVRAAVAEPERHASIEARRASPHATRRAVIVVAIVIVGTIVGFAYLTQTLGANASSAEIRRSAVSRDALQNNLLSQASIIALRTTDGVVEAWAVENGLVDLGDPLVAELP